MAAADAHVAALTATIDYLRISVGRDADGSWWPCAELVGDPAALGALATGTADGWITDRPDVATSLFVQGYAFRIASVTIGTWVLADAPVAVDPAATSIALGGGAPNAVRLDAARVLEGATPRHVHEHLVDRHLAPLVETAHASCRIGRTLLWGNVASACASCFNAVADALPERRAGILARAAGFFATARPALRDAGRLVPVGTQAAWERRSCCLWYRTGAAPGLCADCSLHTDADRHARYDAMLAAQHH